MPGHGLAEIAWLARSFELGNAGNPPDGTCGSPLFNFTDDKIMLGMYSCVTADAPRKGNATEEPAPEPEHFTGFVKVMRMDNIMKTLDDLCNRDVTVVGQDSAEPTSTPSETQKDEIFSFEAPGSQGSQVLLQRISDDLCHIGEVEVEVKKFALHRIRSARSFVMVVV